MLRAITLDVYAIDDIDAVKEAEKQLAEIPGSQRYEVVRSTATAATHESGLWWTVTIDLRSPNEAVAA